MVSNVYEHDDKEGDLLLLEGSAASEQGEADCGAGEGASSSSGGLDGGRHGCLWFLLEAGAAVHSRLPGLLMWATVEYYRWPWRCCGSSAEGFGQKRTSCYGIVLSGFCFSHLVAFNFLSVVIFNISSFGKSML